jgi:ubiquinone/menaquinone biosynthesis C-methylase UbiE
VNYDPIAPNYDRRYQLNDYSGVERALVDLVECGLQARPARALEVGCGTGHWLGVLERRFAGVHLAGVDLSSAMLRRVRENVAHATIVQGRAERLPFSDKTVDWVFCVNALHHFDDKPGFLGEARRVLRPGGTILSIGLDPHERVDRWYIYEYFEGSLERDLARYASTGQIRAWMREAGFSSCQTREIQHIPWRMAASAALDIGRLDRSATSQLAMMSDAEYERGIERIRDRIARCEAAGECLDLEADLRLYATTGLTSGSSHGAA